MRNKLFIVRHGEAAASWGNHSDPGLSELGESQADAASKKLIDILDSRVRIVSSPLLRARKTAAPLAAAVGKKVEVDERFREIEAPVSLKLRQSWIKKFSKQTWNSQNNSLREWRRRALEGLLEYDGCTVIFTHFMILNTAVGIATDQINTLCFRPDYCSITKLQSDGRVLELMVLGDELSTPVL